MVSDVSPAPPPDLIRTLLADDSPQFRLFIRTVLEACGDFEVVAEAADGGEAIRLASQYRPHLLLLDVSMPRVDGIQATPDVRRTCPDTKIVWLSGLDASDVGMKAVELGADAFLPKCVPPEQLVTRLVEICNGERG